jgi:amidase
MRNVLDYDTWLLDESVIAPWRSPPLSAYRGKGNCDDENQILTLGVILEDPKYPLHPPVLRNFQNALSKLASAGHKLISLESHLPQTIPADAATTAFTMFSMDPKKTSLSHLATSGEPCRSFYPGHTIPGAEILQSNA